MLSCRDDLHEQYLSIFMSNLSQSDLWKRFLLISEKGDINEVAQKHLTTILTQRMQNVPVEEFIRYSKSVKIDLNSIKEGNRPYFLKVSEAVTYAFLNKQLNDDSYRYKLSEGNLKELVNITHDLASIHGLLNRSYILVIQYLLFRSDEHVKLKPKKIKRIFDKLNDLSQGLHATDDLVNIIQDDCLSDHLINIPQEWMRVSPYDYESLCTSHRNNSLSIHIWSRIVWLSLSKIDAVKWNEILIELNKWLISVKHQYILKIKEKAPSQIDAKLIDDFVERAKQSVADVLLLNGTRTIYLELSDKSIAYQFLPQIDLNNILTSQDPQKYKFPITSNPINCIMSVSKPDDIDIIQTDTRDQYFLRFIEQVTAWIRWFDQFIDIFQYVIERFIAWKMEGAEQLFKDIHTIKHDPETTLTKMKTIIQQLLKIFNAFDNLHRLCDLFDFLKPFQIICNGALSHRGQFKSHMEDIQKSFPNNTFTVNGRTQEQKCLPIYEHRHVHWSVACTEHHCNIKVEYRLQNISNQIHELYNEKDVMIDKNYLYGEFKTQHSGQLVITINNQNPHTQRTLWYSVVQDSIPTCHLFQGILDVYYQKYFKQSTQLVKEKDLSQLITRVFSFIDNLLNGNTTLQEMDCLRTVFHEKMSMYAMK
ncbi:hypothetical protein I4U23_014738 [Adineta vaga]|nr:hypothetical protein I4U23_014738 [Adineta vaga]